MLIRPRVDSQRQRPERLTGKCARWWMRGRASMASTSELLESARSRSDPDAGSVPRVRGVAGGFGSGAGAHGEAAEACSRSLPHTLEDVFGAISSAWATSVGEHERGVALANGCVSEWRLIATTSWRIARSCRGPRVVCLEWLDPFYVAGHWVPEMVAKRPAAWMCLAQAGSISVRVTSEQIAQCHADVMIVMPCGYDAERSLANSPK